jgi:hypothetical protein
MTHLEAYGSKGTSMAKKILTAMLLCAFFLSGCQLTDVLNPIATAAPTGTLLFSDDFTNNSNHWGVSNGDTGSVNFLYQGLDIKVNESDSMVWSVAGQRFQDVQIDVDGVLLSGPTDDIYGAICRFQDNQHFYGFLVTHDGYYGIFKMQDGKLSLADAEGGLKYSEVIRQGGVVNHIQAVCQGDLLKLSVNDQLLTEVEDSSLTEGQVGLIAGSYTTPGVEVFFDNLKVSQP